MIKHDTFVIERTYDAPVERVYEAWSDPDVKLRWFVAPGEHGTKHTFDFRVGGHETAAGGPEGGTVYSFDATYFEIIPNERLVYAYEMFADDTRISVSVATIEFTPSGSGTTLVVTELGAFLDGHDTVASREEGTRGLLDQLGTELARTD